MTATARPTPARRAKALLAENEAAAAELLMTDIEDRPSPMTAARNRVRMEYHISHGQPHFSHNLHALLSIVTVGLWLPMYWACWMGSARRRYQRQRRALLRAEGLID